MLVVTSTMKHEKDDGLSVAARLIAGAGNWIPAPVSRYGVTFLRRNDDCGVVWAIFRVMTRQA